MEETLHTKVVESNNAFQSDLIVDLDNDLMGARGAVVGRHEAIKRCRVGKRVLS